MKNPFSCPGRPRFIGGVVALVLLAMLSLAHAQVTLELVTPQQATCTVVTDGLALRLVPYGTMLQATGVYMTGAGCGQGVPGSNFAASVSVPAGVAVGTPFNVSWSATSAATRCTYGGTPGASGWPVGSLACQAGTCAGSHSSSVVVPSAGNYVFSMTCTNESGYALDGSLVGGP